MRPPDFKVHVVATNGQVVVTVSGDLDMATAPELWQELSEAIPEVKRRMVIDLAGAGFIDSSGMTVFVKAHKRLQRGGAGLVLRSPTTSARKVLALTGLDQVLTIEG